MTPYELLRLCGILDLDFGQALRIWTRDHAPSDRRQRAKSEVHNLLLQSRELRGLFPDPPPTILARTEALFDFVNAVLTRENWIEVSWLTLVRQRSRADVDETSTLMAQHVQETDNYQALDLPDVSGRGIEQVRQDTLQLQSTLSVLFAVLITEQRVHPFKWEWLKDPPLRCTLQEIQALAEAGVREAFERHPQAGFLVVKAIVEHARSTGRDVGERAREVLEGVPVEHFYWLSQSKAKSEPERSPSPARQRVLHFVAGKIRSLIREGRIQRHLRVREGILWGDLPRDTEAGVWFTLGQFLGLRAWPDLLGVCSVANCLNLFVKRKSRWKRCRHHRR